MARLIIGVIPPLWGAPGGIARVGEGKKNEVEELGLFNFVKGCAPSGSHHTLDTMYLERRGLSNRRVQVRK